MNNSFKEIEMKFKAAIDTVTVERGLSNLELFKSKYQDAFDQMHQRPYMVIKNYQKPQLFITQGLGFCVRVDFKDIVN